MNAPAETKIRMLRNSLRCFACGVLGLLPVIGLPFAFTALFLSGKIRADEKCFWNAGRPYRIWGIVCAAGGILFWCFIAALLFYHAASQNDGGGWGGLGSE